MGIPYYFSYIVKNHSNIIKKLDKNSITINNFFLDCNSIIYDVVHTLNFTEITDSIYSSIINNVILKIENYISIVSPNNIVYISFDGVAPVAKLQQQRERRYKSWYQSDITKKIFKKVSIDPFNTTAITPGTDFMIELNTKIKKHFFNNETKFNINKFIISGSDESGEGEHKLFEYIRSSNITTNSSNLVYGLDADLIMLSINHLPINSNIYLFRETPEFIKSLDSSLEPNENYYLDIPIFSKIIELELNNNKESNINRVYDYIFICFFLGNDFMPHFPSINIRTGGIDKMINAYKATIGSTNEIITDGIKINWKNVRKLIIFLANLEEKHLIDEMSLRNKREKFFYPTETPEEIFSKFENIPTIEREIEKFINPSKDYWQKRYYSSLFSVNINEERKKQICTNYLEGLEWTMKYYTTGCIDWRWFYKYEYPPLLVDLIKYIPYFDTTFIQPQTKNPVSPLVQLSYVLPKTSLEFLPKNLYNKLINEHPEWYPDDCEFIWAFCKYFWESHVQLPEIDLNELEKIVSSLL